MLKIQIILVAVISFFVFSCSDSESPTQTKQFDLSSIEKVVVHFTGIAPLLSKGEEYWKMEASFSVEMDTVKIMDDILIFSSSFYNAYGTIKVGDTGGFNYTYIYMNYRHGLAENILTIDGPIEWEEKGDSYVLTRDSLANINVLEAKLIYEHSLYSVSNRLNLTDSSRIEIIIN